MGNCPTVIHEFRDFTGVTIISPLDLSRYNNLQVTEGGLVLSEGIDRDYTIDLLTNSLVFVQPINELDVRITYFDVCNNDSVLPQNLETHPDIETAKAAGLEVGQFFCLSTENTPQMYRNVVVYIAQ